MSVRGDASTSYGVTIEDDAVVEGHAQISEDVVVKGSAYVADYARVFGNAVVGGTARILGRAQIGYEAEVLSDRHWFVVGPVGSENRYVTVYRTRSNKATVIAGCFTGTVQELADRVKPEGGHGWYSNVDGHRADYESIVKLAKAREREWKAEAKVAAEEAAATARYLAERQREQEEREAVLAMGRIGTEAQPLAGWDDAMRQRLESLG
jgi:carbonic anhydrase/acetyltransferase-like protein (isoleucine patch superfamily)